MGFLVAEVGVAEAAVALAKVVLDIWSVRKDTCGNG